MTDLVVGAVGFAFIGEPPTGERRCSETVIRHVTKAHPQPLFEGGQSENHT